MIEIYKNRPTRAIVSFKRLRHNLTVVKSFLKPEVKILGTVKANAYGHGILEISKELLENGVNYLGVAYVEEAVYLRKKGITVPILVLGAINDEQIPLFLKHDIEITSSSLDKSKAINEVAKRMNKTARIHLKIDTGMERIGVHWYGAEKFISESQQLDSSIIIGLFSHLARADKKDFSQKQIQRFDKIVQRLKQENRCPEIVHFLNSSGIINYPEAQYNMVRAGIILYGYTPEVQEKLKPVMTLKTKVSYFKVVPEKTGIGYNHTYVTKSQTRLATLPIGYGDGYLRTFSNKGEVLIRGEKYPVVGTVCMDQIMIDLGKNGEAYNGDDVLIFGEDLSGKIPLEKLCEDTGTIPYEILCYISSRVPRIYE